MFGYVLADRRNLTKEENETYGAYYCGLCASLAKLSAPARLTLNFDLAFLSLFLTSYFNGENSAASARCALHPLSAKKRIVNEFSDYAAQMSILLSYFKLEDDLRDENSLSARAGMRIAEKHFAEVCKAFPQKAEEMKAAMDALRALEDAGSHDFEACAAQSGRLLACVFDRYGNDGLLRAFGYSLGRAIYVLDACVDAKSDIKNERFNPMVEIPSKEFQQILTVMLTETTNIYDKMNITLNKGIIENILYCGIWTKFSLRFKEKN